MVARRQLGFVEAFASQRLGRNERLDRIGSQVKWYRFEKKLKRGTMMDRTLVEAAAARPSGDGQSCDEDARFAKKEGKAGSVYGYKAHIGMDQESELIRTALMTPANVNETTVADQLIRFD